MHELASASPPYERVPNILRYTVNNLFIIYLCNSNLRLVVIIPCITKSFLHLSFCHRRRQNHYQQRLCMILMHMRSPAYWREMINNVNLNIATLLKTLTSCRESGALAHGSYYELATNTECQHPFLCFK